MRGELFRLDHVSASRRGRLVLDDLALCVNQGITCILGPSGAGKSTLLRLLNRLAEPDEGAIYFEGQPIKNLGVLDLRRRAVYMPQIPTPFTGTVHSNVTFGTELAARSVNVSEVLELVALDPSFAEREATQLSVGEQQRVTLARAIALRPDVLLLDEPTASLDEQTTSAVEGTLIDLAGKLSLPMVLVTHDQAQTERIADSVVKLEGGKAYTVKALNRLTEAEIVQ